MVIRIQTRLLLLSALLLVVAISAGFAALTVFAARANPDPLLLAPV